MLPSELGLLRHIFDEISFALNATAGKDKERVIGDPVVQGNYKKPGNHW